MKYKIDPCEKGNSYVGRKIEHINGKSMRMLFRKPIELLHFRNLFGIKTSCVLSALSFDLNW